MGIMSFMGDMIGGAVEKFCDGVSLVVDTLSGVARKIGDGIKSICDKIGTEGMVLIGCVALSLIIPGFGIPEILTLIQIVGKIANGLNIGGKDTPEELGMKTEIADKKPDDFESTEQYLEYLNKEVKLEPGSVEKLSPEEKAKYGLIGSALDIKAIQEKYNVELSPDFLRDVTVLKMTGEEVTKYVKHFADRGITKMQDMTDYLRGNAIKSDKREISENILDTMKTLYPELNEEQLENKLYELSES